MFFVLFNPLSNNGRGEENSKEFVAKLNREAKFKSVIGLDFKEFFDGLEEEDEVLLCGGDGTINRFANDTYGYEFKNPLFYAKCGSGNDFYRDVEGYEKDSMVDLRPFLKKLPKITVNGIERRFINGIGYGIDGDTCLIGDEIREKDPNAVIDYTKIAIDLLLKSFEVKNATVVADGKEYHFKNAWLSSAMYGKFYGGGMMAAPNQDRLMNNDTCTVTTLSSKGRLVTLLRFPTFSKGNHDKKKFISHIVGHHIEVSFDKPCALQIDGDVIKDVLKYTVDFD